MRAIFLGVLATCGAIAAGSSCVVELEHTLACGDGYVDAAADEECEPDLYESYVRGCEGTGIAGVASCDPESCTIRCRGCGDGFVQTEAGGDLLAEECDEGPYSERRPRPTALRECYDLVSPLTPWRPELPYASGTSRHCTADCYYDRSTCSYCGNGSADASWPLAPDLAGQTTVVSLTETCDGESLSAAFVAAASCPDGYVPNVACAPDCRQTTPRDGAQCCVPPGGPCDDESRCCHAYAHPGELFHCENPITGEPGPGDDLPPEVGRTCR